MKLSNLSKRRLTIAKELWLHGYFHSMKKSLSDVILSILNFDFCTETVIKAVLIDSNVKLSRRKRGFKTFDDLISDLQSLFPNLKYLDEIVSLHKLRNDVQHQSVIPSEQEVSRHKITARLFFDEVCRNVYSGVISFDEVSLALFIKSEIEKFILKEMENAFQNSQYSDSVYYAKQAIIYHLLLLRANMGVPYTDPLFHSPFTFSGFDGLEEIGRFLENTSRCLNWIIDRLCLREYCDDICHLLDVGTTSNIYWLRGRGLKRKQATQNDVEQAKNLAYEFMISTQHLIKEPDLESPFIYDLTVKEGASENEHVIQVGIISLPKITEAKLTIRNIPTKEEIEAGVKQVEKILDIPIEMGLHKIVIKDLEKGKRYSISVNVTNEKKKSDSSTLVFQ